MVRASRSQKFTAQKQTDSEWYVRRVHENLLHENGLPHTGSEWYVRRVHKNLLHKNGHHIHENLRVVWFLLHVVIWLKGNKGSIIL